ncbi:hypothetical protein [Streptomyces mirabilis]|uniref:hypothetical protein n=1 Tax=Streptomyces mirabilis TaxID=68239 RepID=UPI00368AAC9F
MNTRRSWRTWFDVRRGTAPDCGPGPYRQPHFDVFDFALTPDEVAAIDALDTGVRGGPDPDSLDLQNAGFPIPD